VGGVIVCDDYGAPTFPGARRAWERFFARHEAGFVVLPTGQSVFLKGELGR
jgi:O-methyltransferase